MNTAVMLTTLADLPFLIVIPLHTEGKREAKYQSGQLFVVGALMLFVRDQFGVHF